MSTKIYTCLKSRFVIPKQIPRFPFNYLEGYYGKFLIEKAGIMRSN